MEREKHTDNWTIEEKVETCRELEKCCEGRKSSYWFSNSYFTHIGLNC